MPDTTNHTPRRTIRSPGRIWNPALERARREGTDLSKVLNSFLDEYGRGAELPAAESNLGNISMVELTRMAALLDGEIERRYRAKWSKQEMG
jgi:hypothetical protein